MKKFFVSDSDYNQRFYPQTMGRIVDEQPGPDIEGCWFEFPDDSLEAKALKWLESNCKYPICTDRDEYRWYPSSGTNLKYFSDHLHCLLPPDVYYALDFPLYKGEVYPWLKFKEAILLALTQLIKLEYVK